MTAAELHFEMEKEQEARVNRLSRELSQLHQQAASIMSGASSRSASLNDPQDYAPLFNPRSRNPSSSSFGIPSFAVGTSLTSVSGITPPRDSVVLPRPALDHHRGKISREPSLTSPGLSGTSSPALMSSLQRPGEKPISSNHPSPNNHLGSSAFRPSPTLTDDSRCGRLPSSSIAARYEEATARKAELDAARRENEVLRRRVRELEMILGQYRRSSPTRQASGSTRISSLTVSLADASIDDNH
ncbi:predicted protein [Uncinocarpus reesii 1704]|uniref:Uncharacterized protein n=1 Tax=Uncinocarpus reesii (strain UAMH 1704) TaxID=336963 RepID=C4JJ50_UNCRE|nr:uncharacterized protein UREG_01657 [Uncinocarpus reesii 1704]EEP76808.1 predicted protein [Uncinocarpus reesii 1704]